MSGVPHARKHRGPYRAGTRARVTIARADVEPALQLRADRRLRGARATGISERGARLRGVRLREVGEDREGAVG
jgi:hypothetical protein